MNFVLKALAASGAELCPDGTIKDPTVGCFEAPAGVLDSNTNMLELIIKGATVFTMFAGSIAVLVFVIAGLQYATAMGDEEKMDTSKRNMKWSAIGLGISILAYGIVEFVIKNIV